MKPLLFVIFCFILGCSSDQPPDCPYINKEFSLRLQLKVIQTGDKEVNLFFKLVNSSSDTAILYKPLLPLHNLLSENIFSIFDTVDYTILKPTFKSKEDYCGGTSNQAGGLILPQLQADKFLFLNPQDSIVSVINLYNYYNFSDARLKGKRYFELAPVITFPLVDRTMHHLTDWDTLYLKYEPVYFDVRLPAKQFNVDSQRIQFSIP